MHQTTNPPIFPYPWATDWGEDQYGLWMGLNHKGVRCVFRWIDPGTFMMGSPEEEEGRYEGHYPATFTQGFWIGETAVTQAFWESVMKENPSHFKGDNRPVEQVSWEDCQRFILKLNAFHLELEVRLPLEVEWEYACRAGTDTFFSFGDMITSRQANYGENLQQTKPVKSYVCNAWGLYDMHGNVWEWCLDPFKQEVADQIIDRVPPYKPAEFSLKKYPVSRICRGGSWEASEKQIRSDSSMGFEPWLRWDDIGFRLLICGLSAVIKKGRGDRR